MKDYSLQSLTRGIRSFREEEGRAGGGNAHALQHVTLGMHDRKSGQELHTSVLDPQGPPGTLRAHFISGSHQNHTQIREALYRVCVCVCECVVRR